MKSRTKAITTVAVVLLVAAAAMTALMVFNKSPNLLDSEFRIIVTGSMDGEPQTEYDIETIPVDSLVAIHKLKGDAVEDVKVGDVIGFYSPSLKGNVYHRVISVDKENRTFITHGDANPPMQNEMVSFDEANGIVVNVSPTAGKVISFMKSNVLYLVLMVVLLLAIIELIAYIIRMSKEE